MINSMRNTYATAPKKTTSVSIAEPLLAEARSLAVNVSQAAEEGVSEAVAAAKAAVWLRENQAAIHAYNRRVEESGMLLNDLRQF
jgi:antitoxin CcdA